VNIASRVKGVDFGRTDEETVFRHALGATDFLVYLNVPSLVDLENVLAELIFYLQAILPLDPQKADRVFQSRKIEQTLPRVLQDC
jgi:hypothetical protein